MFSVRFGCDSTEPCESEKESTVDETEELPEVQVEDTASYLDQLDSEVSHLVRRRFLCCNHVFCDANKNNLALVTL